MKTLEIGRIKEELLSFGMSPQLRAFEWIARAIQLCSEDKTLRESPSGQIYNQLNKEYGYGDSDAILQAIRRAVISSWEKSLLNRTILEKYTEVFWYKNVKEECPLPLEFIVRISDHLSGGKIHESQFERI